MNSSSSSSWPIVSLSLSATPSAVLTPPTDSNKNGRSIKTGWTSRPIFYYLFYKNDSYYHCHIWFELDKETSNPIQSLSSINLTKEQAKEIGIFNDKPLTIENLFSYWYESPDALESLKIENFNNFVSYENF